MDMSCAHCDAEIKAYTLRIHPEESDRDIEISFCSTDCLETWV